MLSSSSELSGRSAVNNDRSASPARSGMSRETSHRSTAIPARPDARAPGGQSKPRPVSEAATQARMPRALLASSKPAFPPALTSAKGTSPTLHSGRKKPSRPRANRSMRWRPPQMRRNLRSMVRLRLRAILTLAETAATTRARPKPKSLPASSKASTMSGASQGMETAKTATTASASHGAMGCPAPSGSLRPERDTGRRRGLPLAGGR